MNENNNPRIQPHMSYQCHDKRGIVVQPGCTAHIIAGWDKLPETCHGDSTWLRNKYTDKPLAKETYTPREAPDEGAHQFRGQATIAGATSGVRVLARGSRAGVAPKCQMLLDSKLRCATHILIASFVLTCYNLC